MRAPGPVTDLGPAVAVVPDGTMAFGLQLPVQAQSTMFVAEWEKRSGPAEIAAVARVLEDAGFFYAGVCDHTAIPEHLAPTMGTVWYDTVATLGWLAGLTDRLRLLSHVLVLAERHPLRAAKELCTLDALSAGRLIAGVGAGHVQAEYEVLGGDFAARGAATDEAVVALLRALSTEYPELDGPRWPVRGMGVAPRPVQTPRPPVWIGGSTRPALRRAAALGDGWLPQTVRRDELADQVAELRRRRDELRGGEPIEIGGLAEPVYLVGPGTGGDESWALPRFVNRATPGEVAESLRWYETLGVRHLQVRFPCRSVGELCDQIAAFGAHVIPLFSP